MVLVPQYPRACEHAPFGGSFSSFSRAFRVEVVGSGQSAVGSHERALEEPVARASWSAPLRFSGSCFTPFPLTEDVRGEDSGQLVIKFSVFQVSAVSVLLASRKDAGGGAADGTRCTYTCTYIHITNWASFRNPCVGCPPRTGTGGTSGTREECELGEGPGDAWKEPLRHGGTERRKGGISDFAAFLGLCETCVSMEWHGHLGRVRPRAGSPCHRSSYSPISNQMKNVPVVV
jgi:hypothetical protein